MPLVLADFHPAVPAALSRHIRADIAAGKPHDQAIALALRKCAPDRSANADDLTHLLRQLRFREKLGGNYLAEKQPDGTWTIFNVPIMGTLEEGVRRNPRPIDRAWLQAAVAKSQELEHGGHLAPVHLEHHDDKAPFSNRRIGFLRVRRVGSTRVGSETMDAIFADIVQVAEADIQLLEAAQYPYRSVEIANWSAPQVASLAVMNNESPFFKFPMLTIERQLPTLAFSQSTPPALCAFGDETVGAVLWQFGDAAELDPPQESLPMKPQDIINAFRALVSPVKHPRTIQLLDQAAAELTAGKIEALKSTLEQVPARLQEEEEKKDKKPDDNGDKMMEGAGQMGQILSLLQAIASRIGITAPAAPMGAPPVEQQKDHPAAKPDPVMAQLSDAVAKLTGQVTALQQTESQRQKSTTLQTLIDETVQKLKTGGWNVDEKVRETMREMAENSVDPAKSLKLFADSFRATTPLEPPARFESYVHPPVDDTDPTLLKMRAAGPQEYERGQKMYREWKDHCRWRNASQLSFEDFVETQKMAEQLGFTR